MDKTLVQIKIPVSLKAKFYELAKTKGYTMSGYIVKLINDELEK